MVNDKIWITGIWGEAILQSVLGLETDGNVEIIAEDFRLKTQIAKIYQIIIRRLGGKGRWLLQKALENRMLDRFYKLTECDFSQSAMNDIVIFNSALVHYYSKGYLKRLKKRVSNIRLVLYIVDPMPNGIWDRITDMKDQFDIVLTAHPYNANRYGFQYLPFIYTPPRIASHHEAGKELYFVGTIDGHRYEMIRQFIAQCRKHEISYEMHFFRGERFERIEDADVYYGLLEYRENVERAVNSNCILEIVRDNFVGFTQRYYEAIVFNKKLLTNNKEIKNMPYYDEHFMQYFEKVEEIDWNWVRESVEVDYHYRGDFSPERWKSRLLEMIGPPGAQREACL